MYVQCLQGNAEEIIKQSLALLAERLGVAQPELLRFKAIAKPHFLLDLVAYMTFEDYKMVEKAKLLLETCGPVVCCACCWSA